MLERTEAAILFDFYGKLLTERQQEVMEAYYEEDLSLGEIAENLGISRPGVHDLLQRSTNQLVALEEKLALATKDRQRQELVAQVRKLALELGEIELAPNSQRLLTELLAELGRVERI